MVLLLGHLHHHPEHFEVLFHPQNQIQELKPPDTLTLEGTPSDTQKPVPLTIAINSIFISVIQLYIQSLTTEGANEIYH